MVRAESDQLKIRLQQRAERLRDITRVSKLTVPVASREIPALGSLPFRRKRVLKVPSGKVHAVSWDPDSRNIMSASQDGYLIIWNALTGHKLQAITLQLAWVTSCAYAPGAPVVASGGLDNVCSLYNLRRRQSLVSVPLAQTLVGHQGYISAIEFIDDNQVLTASGDSTCALWDVASASRIRTFARHSRDVTSLSLANSNVFVSGSCDARAYVWDLRVGDAVQTFTVGGEDINTVRCHPSGRAFATGSENGATRLYDMASGCKIADYTGAGSPVQSVDFSHTGRLLFAGSGDGKVIVWDALRAERAAVLSTHDSTVAAVRVSPDGNMLATGSWDTKVVIYGQ